MTNSIFSVECPVEDSLPICAFQTGTNYDLMTGQAVSGLNGNWYIHGGLRGAITALYGQGNSYKSTILDSLLARCQALYGGDHICVDTEGIKTIERFQKCAGELAPQLDTSNIRLYSGTQLTVSGMLKWLKEIGEYKIKHKKDYTFETPFLTPEGKRILAWRPTFVYFDSFTEMVSEGEDAMVEKEGLAGGKTKTAFMHDGQQKTLFIRHMRRYCELYGFVFVMSAHVGSRIDMQEGSGNRPKPKDTQFMKQDEKLKGVGSKLLYLAHDLVKTERPTILTDKSTGKSSEYPMGHTPAEDVNEVMMRIVRSKRNMSGTTASFIVSQNTGLLNGVTHYHNMRRAKYEGLLGNDRSHQCALYPDTTLQRTTFRQKSSDNYELQRAIELCGQMLFIKQHWAPIAELPILWEQPIEKIAERLHKLTSPKTSDIVNSTGVWQPDERMERPYMSVFDVMELLSRE